MKALTDHPDPQRIMTSRCRSCFANNCRHLHRQLFILPGVDGKLSYDVLACNSCGFVFADNIPDPESLLAYYQEAEHHLHPAPPPGLTTIHRDFFEFIKQHVDLPKDVSILDVGSGMGHFLNIFKDAGYGNLLGLEPSRNAMRQAAKRYGIEILPKSLGSFVPSRPFELITMCGVLEHISDILATLAQIRTIGTSNALIFLAVPDAARFGTTLSAEPFLEFALEHINFFTPDSLRNLLGRHGYASLAIESRTNSFYNNSYIYALFQACSASRSPQAHDASGEASVLAYIKHSNESLAAIRTRLDDLADRQTPTIIWGAGALSTRLCATISVERLRLLGFVDKNRQLQGKSILGANIHPPKWLYDQDRNSTVIIFSTTYSAEIVLALKEQFNWRGEILQIAPSGYMTTA